MSASQLYAVLNYTYTLTKTATQAANVSATLAMKRSTGAMEVNKFAQSRHTCTSKEVESADSGYRTHCGNGNDSGIFTTKHYLLEINRVATPDITSW